MMTVLLLKYDKIYELSVLHGMLDVQKPHVAVQL